MGSKAYPYFKWSVILIGIIFCFLLFRRCGHAGGTITKTDTISIKAATIYTDTNTSITYVPKPYKVEVPKNIPVYLESEPEYEYLPIDSYPPKVKAIIIDYYSKKFYDTTLSVPYGKLNLKDTVLYNGIIGRSFSLDQSIPEITSTITLREKKRNVFYIGAEYIGNQNTPYYGTGATLGFVNKRGTYWGVGALLLKDQNSLYKIEAKLAIRLKKREP